MISKDNYTPEILATRSTDDLQNELSECRKAVKSALEKLKKSKNQEKKLYELNMAELFMLTGKACEEELIRRKA